MIFSFRLLAGLPPYGAATICFPSEWGRLGREGVVVEFASQAGSWVGNFAGGLGGLTAVHPHPNDRDVVVIAAGDLWVVDMEQRSAEVAFSSIDAALDVQHPPGWVFSRQRVALARFGPGGLIWHTRRLSWDGFDQLKIVGGEITGRAWSPIRNQWLEFQVDLRTGKSSGGANSSEDSEQWEQLVEGKS